MLYGTSSLDGAASLRVACTGGVGKDHCFANDASVSQYASSFFQLPGGNGTLETINDTLQTIYQALEFTRG